jgi:hypothetical protein
MAPKAAGQPYAGRSMAISNSCPFQNLRMCELPHNQVFANVVKGKVG